MPFKPSKARAQDEMPEWTQWSKEELMEVLKQHDRARERMSGKGVGPVAFYASAKGNGTYWAAEKARAADRALPYMPSVAELMEAAALPYPPSVADMQEAAMLAPSIAEMQEAVGATKMPSIVELAGRMKQFQATKGNGHATPKPAAGYWAAKAVAHGIAKQASKPAPMGAAAYWAAHRHDRK